MSFQKTTVIKEFPSKSILVSREFNSSVELVWRCYTEQRYLDQWWGPAPWRAETKTMKFENGGFWHYAMVGPDGEKHWGIMNYNDIIPLKQFEIEDAFCDENAIINSALPVSKGSMVFRSTENGTLVEFKMTYATEEQLQTLIEMGFEEGITVCLEQLSQLLLNI